MDFRSFIEEIKETSPREYLEIDKEVDPKYEISAIIAVLEKRRNNAVVRLNNVRGTRFPVVTNVYGTRERIAKALSTTEKEVVAEYVRRAAHPIKPVEVASGPAQDVVLKGNDVDLLGLPQIVHHEGDVGPYISAGITVAKDPEDGTYNVSYNRYQIKDQTTLGTCLTPGRHLREFYCKAEAMGKPLEVAILIGNHPIVALGALFAGPLDQDEMGIMGALAGKPIELVRCKTVDLKVPTHTEMVIEGEILPNYKESEGPFGEFTGYSIGARMREILKVKAITHRNNAVFQDMLPSHMDHLYLASIPLEASLYKSIKATVPTLQAVKVPAPFTVFLSIKQTALGQAKNAIFSALAADMYIKTAVVVDEDIDVGNTRQVLWAIATRAQADRDVFVVPNARGADLDPSCEIDGITAKMGIDATAKPSLSGYAARNRIPADVLRRVEEGGYFI